MKLRIIHKTPLIIPSLFILLVLSPVSCSEDENGPYSRPLISFTTSEGYLHADTSLAMNDTALIGIEASAGSNLDLTLLHTYVERDGEFTKFDSGMHTPALKISRLITKSLSETETWSFYVKDMEGNQSDTISLILTRKAGSQFGPILRFDSLRLGAQNHVTAGNLLSLPSGQAVSFPEGSRVQEEIWLLYYYDNLESDKHTIASPGANIDASIYDFNGWTQKNTSRFIANSSAGSDAFRQASNDSLILLNSFDFESGKRKAKELNAGDIYSFEMENGTKGMFMISEVNGTVDGWVEFEMILQKK
ncbi:hypothetical protein ACFLTU_02880 [Bacteroidota bacterium]